MRPQLLAVALALSLLPTAARAQVPRGPEFQVNTFTSFAQFDSAVAADAGGRFVVSWSEGSLDGSNFGIFARRFEASGAPIGATEFRVNSFTTGRQDDSAVAAAPDGTLLFVWTNFAQAPAGGVSGRLFDASGTPLGVEFAVNTYTTDSQSAPVVGADADGDFVSVWRSIQDGSLHGVYGQRYDAAGTAQGPEFQVNTLTLSNQDQPALGVAGDGSFLVAWEGWSHQDGSFVGVFAQRFDGAGAPAGPEFQVNVFTTGYQVHPAVAADAAGNFVVVWTTAGQFPGSGVDVMARRYDASGAPLGGEFRVNAYVTGDQEFPTVASDPAGNFVVAWHGPGANDDAGVFARWFESSGAAGAEFAVNSVTTGAQGYPAAAADAQGNFVVSWTADDGSGDGVFARQFRPERIFRDDFETGTLAAWSSSMTDLGDLEVSSAAALDFTSAGLLGLVDDTAGLFVQDDTPDDEARYRVRFHFDPNGFDPGEAENHRRTRIFIAFSEAPARRVAAIVLRRLSGAYAVMGRARLDDDAQADTGFFPISDAPHVVELDLEPAAGPDTLDGSFELRIDGVPQAVLTGLDNSLARVDFARLGALSVKTGASGTMYWDEFESWRTTFPAP